MRTPLRLSQQVVNFLRLGFSTCLSSSAARALVFACVSLLLLPSALQAQLVHRYSFSETSGTTVFDSVGGEHGTIVDSGTAVNFAWIGDQLDLSANTGEGSNVITEDAYVDLPNFIISSAASSGTSGAVTLEFWATVSTTHTWQRFADFGTSNDGEDTSTSGNASQYVLITPNSGRYGNGLEITNHPASDAAEPNVGLNGPFPVGTEQHVTAVYDHNNKNAGPNGTMTMYLNGVEIGQNLLHADFNVNNPIDNNNWLGRSQWNDPIFDGSYNEFRIYDQAVSSNYVRRSFLAGPNGGVVHCDCELVMAINTNTGAATIKNVTDEIFSPVPITFNYYIAESASGALSTTGWNSLSDQGLGANRPEDLDSSGTVDSGDIGAWNAAYGVDAGGDVNNDGETDGTDFLEIQRAFGFSGGAEYEFVEAGGSSANSVAEANLKGSLTLAAGESVSLGNLFAVGGSQDLTFQYGTPGSAFLTQGRVDFVSSQSASATVPEPATLLGILAVAAAVFCRRPAGSVECW